jgi:hypothetical protein
MKKPTKEKMRDKADALCTPIVKLISPNCEACGMSTQVCHHWIEKSRSNRLRHDPMNFIALCQSCHTKIHNLFGNSIVGGLNVADIIREKRGKKWCTDIIRIGNEIVKADYFFFEGNFNKLTQKLADLTDTG